ncbi:nucleotide-diphospho-sugar transferase [Phycomyces nitens]|nr:nucleotide-diphospho-sugar transferase [Phycomyces nitens]
MPQISLSGWTLPFKIIYSAVISCIFVVPAIVGYALQLHITSYSFLVLGIYGTVVFIFILLQLIFATLNRCFIYRYKKKAPNIVSRHMANAPVQETLVEKDLTDQQAIKPSSLAEHEISEKVEITVMDESKERPATHVGLAVVGYREDDALFSQCLESIQQLKYPDPIKIVVVIDGNEEQDHEMASLFQKAFPGCPVISLEHLLSEIPIYDLTNPPAPASEETVKEQVRAITDEELWQSFFLPTDTCAVCYLQPHRGKRHAMYTAFRVLMAAGCEAVMTTDSDTKFDSSALLELEQALYWYPNIGASAGDVRIWNSKDSLLSFMSSLRYWMAFNIERAAQSLNRCVTCVSGPMGLYRSNVLKDILDPWVKQRFLGMECTYGDDRHLTNRVLMGGHRVVYTHMAFCETETPTEFLRWFKQQTRWSKSFYREFLWNVQSLHKHSPWMAAELFYQGLYPFVLLFSILYILWAHAPIVLAIWLVSLFAIASIKTIYSLVVSQSLCFLAFPFYSVYYLLGLVPAKIWALVSLWDVGWGTSARSVAERKRENVALSRFKESLPVVIWIAIISAGITYNLVSFFTSTKQTQAGVLDPNNIVFYPNPYFTSGV